MPANDGAAQQPIGDWLIFIDTNIFLDFYRSRGDANLALLKRIDEHHKNIVTTSQVEMEFKKNRQKVILESANMLKAPAAVGDIPVFLREAASVKILKRISKESEARVKALRARVNKMMQNPTGVDPVYRCAQRLWKTMSNPLHLSREDPVRLEIRKLAEKRFSLGYPPRKKDDTSIGDAINWEWVVSCAKTHNKNVVIVSRDGDFGPNSDGSDYINDWLAQEFRDRVGKKRKVVLTAKLTEAFKLAALPVSAEEVAAEERDLQENLTSEAPKSRLAEAILGQQLRNILAHSKPGFYDLLIQKYLDDEQEKT